MENRRDERQDREEKIFIEILSASSGGESDSVLLECTTKDLSKSGLKVESEYPFILGAILELLISFESGGFKFLLTGEVRWFDEVGKGRYQAGFEIIEAEHSDFAQWQNMFEDEVETSSD